jgi:hypothetical protein
MDLLGEGKSGNFLCEVGWLNPGNETAFDYKARAEIIMERLKETRGRGRIICPGHRFILVPSLPFPPSLF